ncbi:hypothetical protein BDF14DRAFT_1738895 [Spinellus fusiger]|nr:hypothetical protein BDF14DRAFT_1738895 [Spinellus fusiger]
MSDLSYSERPEWADVTPLPQDDGPNPLVPIAYAIIDMNPAHYTVWQYRQNILFALASDLDRELEFISSIAVGQVKNYQIWHHRQVIVDRLGKGDQELAFIGDVLEEDSKNYHAWSYRQWVVGRFNLWDGELVFTETMLVYDIRNNSAWNHRHFILSHYPILPTPEALDNEIELLEMAHRPIKTVEPFLQSLRESDIHSPHLLSMTIDMHEQEALTVKLPIHPVALELCDVLAERVDPLRQKYWAYKKAKLSLVQ